MIIDAHAHVFDRLRGRVGAGATTALPLGKVRLGEDETIRLMPPLAQTTVFPPEVMLEYMDWAGVDKAVLLQAPFYGDLNDCVRQAVSRWPDRFIGTAGLDPWARSAPSVFDMLIHQFEFRAVKLELSERTGLLGLHPEGRLDQEELRWFWDRCERQNVLVTFDLGPTHGRAYQTAALRGILDRYPGLRIVVAHLAQPPLQESSDERLIKLWQDQLLLARYPNVWLDLAALPAYHKVEDYPYPTARQFLRRAFDLVGSDKLLWGSDVPGLLIHATYTQLISYVTHHCDFLSEFDLAKILGGNAGLVYGTATIAMSRPVLMSGADKHHRRVGMPAR